MEKKSCYLYETDKARLEKLAAQFYERSGDETPAERIDNLQTWNLLKRLAEAEEIYIRVRPKKKR